MALADTAPDTAPLPRYRFQRVILLTLLLFYWIISLRHLTIVPRVYEDEPWQASTAWKLATEGVFGSDMFAGFYGMERHYYGYMPMHPLLLAAIYRVAGLGLFQSRYESLVMGLLTLVLTYALGRRLFGAGVGLLSVALLLSVRTTGVTPSQVTGILLIDIARIARYDMVVPVFGLASLHAYLSGSETEHTRHRWHLLAGLFAALAGLSHVYGVFWILALGLLALWNRDGWRAMLALGIGFAIPWLCYLLYVLSGLPDWAGQTQGYSNRFDLLNVSWYRGNLTNEFRRYGPGLGPPGWHYVLRPGFWATALFVPVSLFVLARQAANGRRRPARAVIVPAFLFPALYGLLLTMKLANYLVMIVPLGAVALSWFAHYVWRRAAQLERSVWIRPALAAILAMVTLEGASRYVAMQDAAQTTTPYAAFIKRVRAYIPAGSTVLALHNYWFGLEDMAYRNWLVPLSLADLPDSESQVPMDAALDAIGPDVILLDSRLLAYFENAWETDPKPDQIRGWMAQRGFVRVGVVEDRAYERIEIFRVEP